MEPLVSGLLNAGGLGIASAILYVLHRDAIKAFREELSKERQSNTENLTAERRQCHEDHLCMEQTIKDSFDRMVDLMEAMRGDPCSGRKRP